MSLILNIDTSMEKASIALARDGKPVCLMINHEQKDHASWIHHAIGNALKESGEKVKHIQAIGITSGPGSYTGLRVGMATAKGLCYALAIPFLTVNTLEAMAYAASPKRNELICPLIDARRMEVFTAIYTHQFIEKMAPTAMILNENSYHQELKDHPVIFFGTGAGKLKQIMDHPNASFPEIIFDASTFSDLISKKFNLSQFTDLSYSEPVYVKEFYMHTLKKS